MAGDWRKLRPLGPRIRIPSEFRAGTPLARCSWRSDVVRLTNARRAVEVQAIPTVAHLALGTLAFGQFLRQQSFSIGLALAGIALWFALIAATVLIAEGKQ